MLPVDVWGVIRLPVTFPVGWDITADCALEETRTGGAACAGLGEIGAEARSMTSPYLRARARVDPPPIALTPRAELAAEDAAATEVLAAVDAAATEVLAAEDAAATEVLAAVDAAATEVLAAVDAAAMEVLAAVDAAATELLAAVDAAAMEVLAAVDAAAMEVLAAVDAAAMEALAAEDAAAPAVADELLNPVPTHFYHKNMS